jgi:uncharacterized membrane protein
MKLPQLDMAPRTVHARRMALASYALLVLLLSVEIFGIVRLQPQTRAFLWVIWIGPLLVFLPGLLRGTWKSYLWMCFVLMVYFMVVCSNLFDPRNGLIDWIILGLICVLFTTAMMYARWRQRELAGTGS